MKRCYVFNGDADGLCALQQLRLTSRHAGDDATEELITGVKRDIALLGRVSPTPGDECTVLDISLDVNREGLMAVLAGGMSVKYFDHHFAGEVPDHPKLAAFLDPSPNVCTSSLVDRHLNGAQRTWAAVGTFGDSLVDEGRALAAATGTAIAPHEVERLREIGVALNYNAYGETIEDLHVPPVELADDMIQYEDPLEFGDRSAAYRRVADGYRQDMELARGLRPSAAVDGAVMLMLPNAPWARRASGTIANEVAKAHPKCAVAIVSAKTGGDYLVSIRVPRDSARPADVFCRGFPTGGGRKAAAGINHLPADRLAEFQKAFEGHFRA